jgi:hypothetical protein
MILGFGIFVIGYAVFYWGWGHFPGNTRYSLWVLLGFGSLWPKISMPAGAPIELAGGGL